MRNFYFLTWRLHISDCLLYPTAYSIHHIYMPGTLLHILKIWGSGVKNVFYPRIRFRLPCFYLKKKNHQQHIYILFSNYLSKFLMEWGFLEWGFVDSAETMPVKQYSKIEKSRVISVRPRDLLYNYFLKFNQSWKFSDLFLKGGKDAQILQYSCQFFKD